MTTTTVTAQLSASDRCDRCGAQAYVLVRLISGSSLVFCAHHYQANAEALAPISAEIVDESNRLMQPN